jgi:hypothetical protein
MIENDIVAQTADCVSQSARKLRDLLRQAASSQIRDEPVTGQQIDGCVSVGNGGRLLRRGKYDQGIFREGRLAGLAIDAVLDL